MIHDLVKRTRSFRRFYEEVAIDCDTLRALVDLARLSGSGSNRQPLKYWLVCNPETNALVFPHLAWAGSLRGWPGPAEGERPAAYIIVLGDREIASSFGVDPGIALQSMMLGATEKGLGGCIIGSVQRQELRQALVIPERFDILYVLALGKPREQVQLETVGADGDIKYWRDPEGVHHVPKRALDDLIVG